MARIDELRLARDLMWESIVECSPSGRAPLMNQWRALEETISDLELSAGKASDPVDEISARRAARGGGTARAGRAERGSR